MTKNARTIAVAATLVLLVAISIALLFARKRQTDESLATGPTGQIVPVSRPDPRRVGTDTTPVYFEYEVDQPVTAIKWGKLQYPAELKAKGVGGAAILEFVVDTAGHVIHGSEHVVRSDHPEFSASAMNLLPTAQLTAAIRKDRHVRQVVQQAFVFAPKQ
jgi:TonB family protein